MGKKIDSTIGLFAMIADKIFNCLNSWKKTFRLVMVILAIGAVSVGVKYMIDFFNFVSK